jgi:hypothetical protein
VSSKMSRIVKVCSAIASSLKAQLDSGIGLSLERFGQKADES